MAKIHTVDRGYFVKQVYKENYIIIDLATYTYYVYSTASLL